MASNVFGNPITDRTLKQMTKYKDSKCITAVDRAYEALLMKNADDKDVKARELVEVLKAKYDNGVVRCTPCLIYNATGDRLMYAGSHDWCGHIDASPYPIMFQNGQWGAFLHVQDIGVATGSVAAVTYKGQDKNGKCCDWTLSWDNPWDRVCDKNRVHTKIGGAGQCEIVKWDDVYGDLKKSGLYHEHTLNGCYSTVISGNAIIPMIEGIMTLEDAWFIKKC
ncbi:hypothetical protein FNV43_RR25129 [Rhamnella rubrinervis]|uniref:23 kDa jasmonate-induced protein-like n=1 Tax=Rhamnella rubrinervis TaxID=2594499 RepID=A0A8K0DSK6_9ROSA|nr:hypothetical protein FNV43_RR25129 [Rhamnella rubrinervis]